MSYYNKQYCDGFFDINTKNGFLPIKDPLRTLPDKYKCLQELINRLHVFQENNMKGMKRLF